MIAIFPIDTLALWTMMCEGDGVLEINTLTKCAEDVTSVSKRRLSTSQDQG